MSDEHCGIEVEIIMHGGSDRSCTIRLVDSTGKEIAKGGFVVPKMLSADRVQIELFKPGGHPKIGRVTRI